MARHRRKKRKSGWAKFLRFILVLLIIFALIATAGTLYAKSKIDKLSHVDINEDALAIGKDMKDYKNIVVLGVDTRDMSKYEGSRTDSIIIVSINKKTNDINLISVYRDSYLDIQDIGFDKVTHAFAYGGPERTINTLNRNLDLNISDFAALNFRTVQKIVDDVGGIEVDVSDEEMAEMNKFIPGTARYLKSDYSLIETAGIQQLDGVQAVAYSRIRHIEGGDYKRTERMRTVLKAVFEQVKTMGLSDLNKMMDDIMPEISTNMTTKDILPLLIRLPRMDIKGSTGWPYDKEGYVSGAGVWYAAPITLESNVVKLHKKMFGDKGYQATEEIKKLSGDISYLTGYYGN